MTVWIIETEAALRFLLSSNLKARGYVAVAMEHAGLVSLDGKPPSVIFLDILYDDDTGHEFLSRLGSHPVFCSVPVVITTTMHQKPDFKQPNIKRVMIKPYGIDEFFTTLHLAIT